MGGCYRREVAGIAPLMHHSVLVEVCLMHSPIHGRRDGSIALCETARVSSTLCTTDPTSSAPS